MKLNKNFLTHVTNNEHYMISTGNTKFKGITKNNDTASFIIEALKIDTTESQIVDKLLEEYDDANREDVEKDVTSIIEKLRNIGAIEE